MEYSSSGEYSKLGTSKVGLDFYSDSLAQVREFIHPDDFGHFMSEFSKEKILERTGKGKVYKINYRLILNNEPVMISLRAGMVHEQDGSQLIVGLNRSSENP
jgi:hypothetical protein